MEKSLIYETLKLYFDGECEVRKGDSGMNNLTRFIRHENQDYVMRIYQNHADVSVVEVEQAILSQLDGMPVPKVVKMKDGKSIARIGNRIGVVFKYLKGETLKLENERQYFEYGKLVGQLSARLNEVSLERGAYLPYYELKEAYPNVLVNGLVEELIGEATSLREQFVKLPHQVIHGDINCSNALMNESGIPCAILDFEFVTWDLRAMEVAICLSELLREERGDVALLKAFCYGYKSVIKLTDEEISMLPWLIRLRRIDVVLHFLGRSERGIETEDIESDEFLRKQFISLQQQHEWLMERGEELMEYLR